MEDALNQIAAAAEPVRTHRHKHVAHSDAASVDISLLPPVTPRALKSILEQMEAFMNLFYSEFMHTSVSYDELEPDTIVGHTQLTIKKAQAYDWLESQQKIPSGQLNDIVDALRNP